MYKVSEDFKEVSVNIIVSLKNKTIISILSSTLFLPFLSFSLKGHQGLGSKFCTLLES